MAREEKDNKDLKDLIDQALRDFNIFESYVIERLTSIRGGRMYVEIIKDKEVLYEDSVELPDGEFDDVKLERELLTDMLVSLIVDGIETRVEENEEWKISE